MADNGDPNIAVALTDDDAIYCIEMRLGDVNVQMHVRSAVDLQRKLSETISLWFVTEVERFLIGTELPEKGIK